MGSEYSLYGRTRALTVKEIGEIMRGPSERELIDGLYDTCRRLAVMKGRGPAGFSPVIGLVSHLLGGKQDYGGLVDYLEFYGRSYLIPSVVRALQEWKIEWPVEVWEIGAGPHAWLGQRLSSLHKSKLMRVDKREEFVPNLRCDLENPAQLEYLIDKLVKAKTKAGSGSITLVFSEFWHCVSKEYRGSIADKLSGFPWVVLEFDVEDNLYGESYRKQLSLFGADPISSTDMLDLFGRRSWESRKIGPYNLFYVR